MGDGTETLRELIDRALAARAERSAKEAERWYARRELNDLRTELSLHVWFWVRQKRVARLIELWYAYEDAVRLDRNAQDNFTKAMRALLERMKQEGHE